MKVRCAQKINSDTGLPIQPHASLTVDRVYHVLELSFVQEKGVTYRLLNNYSSPGLYSNGEFEIVSNKIPEEWMIRSFSHNGFELIPKEWAAENFWDNYFDGNPEEKEIFLKVAKKIIDDEPVEEVPGSSFFPPWHPFAWSDDGSRVK